LEKLKGNAMKPILFVYLFIAGTFLSLYFNKKLIKFYKNKWIMYGFVLFSGLAANQIYEYIKQVDVESKKFSFENESILAEKDTVLSITNSFSILIPKGYRYIVNAEGKTGVYAEKRENDNNTLHAITLSVYKSKEPLDKIISNTVEELNKKYKDVSYTVKTFHSNDKVLRFKFKMEDTSNFGIMRCVIKDSVLYSLLVLSKNSAENYTLQKVSEDLERVVETFSLN
jgi:hypothetical protein